MPGEPKVGELENVVVLAQFVVQYVFRLDVSVDHAPVREVFEGAEHLFCNHVAGLRPFVVRDLLLVCFIH